MKITRICAYPVALPLHEGSYKWSGGKAVTVFDSTVIQVDTDAGVLICRISTGSCRIAVSGTPSVLVPNIGFD